MAWGCLSTSIYSSSSLSNVKYPVLKFTKMSVMNITSTMSSSTERGPNSSSPNPILKGRTMQLYSTQTTTTASHRSLPVLLGSQTSVVYLLITDFVLIGPTMRIFGSSSFPRILAMRLVRLSLLSSSCDYISSLASSRNMSLLF